MNKYSNLPVKELIEKTYSYLDQIDFKPYIEKYEDLHELVWAVEDDYDESELTQNDFLNGWVFNWIDEYELSLYLKQKYNVEYEEIVTTSYSRRQFRWEA